MMETSAGILTIEIKSGQTLRDDMLKGLSYYKNLMGEGSHHQVLIYGGNSIQKRQDVTILPWNAHFDEFLG